MGVTTWLDAHKQALNVDPVGEVAVILDTQRMAKKQRDNSKPLTIEQPCPFCGSDDLQIHKIFPNGSGPDRVKVVCVSCWASGGHGYGHDVWGQNDAIRNWNKRPSK